MWFGGARSLFWWGVNRSLTQRKDRAGEHEEAKAKQSGFLAKIATVDMVILRRLIFANLLELVDLRKIYPASCDD